MRDVIKSIYRFLPVQLLLLHFRKYQLLLVFWLIILLTITGHFAAPFGASTLFYSPEYLGELSFTSMALLGASVGVFMMAWQITTFIIHSHRIPFMGAIRYSFIKYCINNALIPVFFLLFYTITDIRFLHMNEQISIGKTLWYQLGFYLGIVIIVLISFAYFFRVSRDLLKTVISKITNPARIREFIPYDTLDYEMDIIKADTFLTGKLRIKKSAELETYHPRLLNTVLRKHHRNAITATIFALAALLIFGIFMEDPLFRVPAGASFLLLFSIIMGLVGSMKYFLRSWEVLGWILIIGLGSFLVKKKIFDLRSIAYGMDYKTEAKDIPKYDYNNLKKVFTPQRYNADKAQEQKRLSNWATLRKTPNGKKPTVFLVIASGGGSRSAYWTFRSLQYLDSCSNGKLFKNTVLVTGASGGMIGTAYWRELHSEHQSGIIKNVYDKKYLDNVGKDVLNAIIFSLASVDLISPFNKISIAGYSYTKDRGYAMEQELISNTEGVMDKKLLDYKSKEANGSIPMMIVNGTIINDGRKLMMAAQPVSYLTQAEYTLNDENPPIDAVDFAAFFSKQNPYNLRLTTAIRMNASFPIILPVVKLPSEPRMNIMDIGLRDNFGIEIASRYLYNMRDWLAENAGDVVVLQIRDTRNYELFPANNMDNLGSMLTEPVFVIQSKWETFQSYYHEYIKDFSPNFLSNKLHFISLQYIPQDSKKMAALNFHLTGKEQKDILESIDNPVNQKAFQQALQLLQ